MPSNPDQKNPHLILASSSPRRQLLLKEQGYSFVAISPPVEEQPPPPGADAASYAMETSLLKAKSVAAITRSALILAADTVVSLNNTIFGKPQNRDDARRILETLSGTTHQVLTGLTLLDAASERADTRFDTTSISMRKMSETELNEYLDSGKWIGKAGAYGVQDQGDLFVGGLKVSFSNVVGLPLELLGTMLSAWTARQL